MKLKEKMGLVTTLFWLAEYNTTSASLTPDQKNKESHRVKPSEAIKEELVNL